MTAIPKPASTADRRDTLFGVCAALGEATGLAPLLFRLGFVLSMLAVSFDMTVIAYVVTALVLHVARR